MHVHVRVQAAFLVFPQEPVRVPLQPPTSAKVSDSSMWGRLTYVERLLIVLVPSLASLLLLALCLFNFCHWKQPDKLNETVVNTVPDLELSTVETPLVFSPGEGSEGAPAHTPTYTPTSSRPTLEEIRSMVRQEVPLSLSFSLSLSLSLSLSFSLSLRL